MSDHNPLILALPSKPPVKSLHFRFEMFWFRHHEFMSKVFEIWNRPCHGKSVFDRIQCKLKRVKQYFKGWGYNTRGINKKLCEQWRGELLVLEQIEEESLLSYEQMQKKS
jgi:hypothetical protein